MADATYTGTTSASGLNKLWRKVQGKVAIGLNFASAEWARMDDLPEYEIDWSPREITFPIRINKGVGVASIQEFGLEARPSSPNLEEGTLNWVQFNARFTASVMAFLIASNTPNAQIVKQLVYQATSKIDALGEHFSDYFYGLSTAVLAITDTDVSGTTATLTLKNPYGQTDMGTGAPMKKFIASKFNVGEYIALIAAGSDALIDANAIGQVTARSLTNGTVDVTFIGSVSSYTTNGIRVVKSNSLDQVVAGTDLNRGLTGLIDMARSTSLHGFSSSTNADWSNALDDTDGGRFTGLRWHKMKDAVENEGTGTLNMVAIDQGVYRDMIGTMQSAVRFNDPFALEIDGDIKSKGVTFFKSKRVPPGYVIAWDKKSIMRMSLLKKPKAGDITWKDGVKLIDRNGWVFGIDWPVGMVIDCRKNIAIASGLVQQ
jgi:hypothetical protein